MSDSSYRKINQQDIGPLTAIHSYSSATFKKNKKVLLTNILLVEKLVMHVGHNCIDRGQNGKKPCEQLSETIEKSIKNLKPQRVAVCKTTPVKNVFFAEIKTTLK